MTWFDPLTAEPSERPEWIDRKRRSILPLLVFMIFAAIGGMIAWNLLAWEPEPVQPVATVDDADSEHRAAVESQMSEQTGLLVIISERLKSPTPTATATKRPTSEPVAVVKNPFCQDSFAEGTQCRLMPWTPTPRAPTPTIGPCYLLTPTQFGSPECIVRNTPTPDLDGWSD